MTTEEIISIGYKAGFHVDHVDDEYGFINEDGDVDNVAFIKFAGLIEQQARQETLSEVKEALTKLQDKK